MDRAGDDPQRRILLLRNSFRRSKFIFPSGSLYHLKYTEFNQCKDSYSSASSSPQELWPQFFMGKVKDGPHGTVARGPPFDLMGGSLGQWKERELESSALCVQILSLRKTNIT